MITAYRFGQKRAAAPPVTTTAVLAKHPVFSGIDEDARRELASKGSLVRIPNYSLLFHQGDDVTAVYLVLEGLIKVYRMMGNTDRTIGFLYRPDILGLESIYSDAGHPHSAQALGAVSVCAFPKEAVLSLASTRTDFSAALFREFTRFIEAGHREQDILTHRTTNGRIADKILTLTDKFGRAEPHGIVLQLRITQRELASMAGTNRESVCKALTAFKQEGSIDMLNKLIVVKNRSKLANWP